MRWSWAIPTLLLAACKGDKSASSADDSTGGDASPPCEVIALDSAWPDDGLSPASRDLRLTLGFSGAASAEGVAISVLGPNGAAVDGTTTVADGSAVWAPSALLDANTAYTWTATVCTATGGGSFTTGDYGDRVDGATLTNTAFALDLNDATWVKPANGGSLFASLFSGSLLLGVQVADDTQIDLIAAVGQVLDDGTVQQDPCYATADFDPASFANNPYASVGPTVLDVTVQGLPISLKNVAITGAFTDSGTTLAAGTLAAEADARDIADAVGYTPDDLCTLLQTFAGLSCEACSSDGETYCVDLNVQDVAGTVVPTLRVVPNTDPQECGDTGGA